jgi:hypothetical protein
LAHVRSEFEFTVHAPYKTVAPLFGPQAEAAWAGHDWNPVFLYPQPARDIKGSVFTVQHGAHRSVWVTTAYDLEAGHIQYVYVMDDVVSTLIDIHLSQPEEGNATTVKVAYERTALRPEANGHVNSMGASDGKMGKEWEAGMDGYLTSLKK